jgi:hypothetical protein
MKALPLFLAMAATAGLLYPLTINQAIAQSGSIEWDDCVQVYNVRRGESCGTNQSLDMKVRNRCLETIDAKFCIERLNGSWDCGMQLDMPSGAETSTFTCKSTGRVWTWARKAGSHVKTPSPGRE